MASHSRRFKRQSLRTVKRTAAHPDKVIARYHEMFRKFKEMPLEELERLRHTKMSQTDFHALKNAIDTRGKELSGEQIQNLTNI